MGDWLTTVERVGLESLNSPTGTQVDLDLATTRPSGGVAGAIADLARSP